ncbi:MAG: hypothetical protein H6719_14830 [Sandaracinaceae bacterium]|nr:hypothetical protein [Sandaracinaceae bacterium]
MTTCALASAVRADDLEAAAIAIAADENPFLGDLRQQLDDLATILAPAVRAQPVDQRLAPLVKGFYGHLGFSTPESYDDPRLHRLDRVLARREGSPVALAVALIAIGERLGVPLSGVAFPGHFMVRYEADEPVFIDPASGAFPFPAASLLALASEELSLEPRDARRFLSPVTARTMAVRLLQNLAAAHEARGDLGRAMLVFDRLYEITGSPSARCDRGLRAAALGAPHGALDDLTAYLRERPDRAVSRTAARLAPTALDLN